MLLALTSSVPKRQIWARVPPPDAQQPVASGSPSSLEKNLQRQVPSQRLVVLPVTRLFAQIKGADCAHGASCG